MPETSERISFTLEREIGGGGTEPPEEVQLLPSGEVRPRGKTAFVVDEEARALMMAAYEEAETDLVIDYEHQSLSGSEAPAAGWVRGLADRGEDGIWAAVEWTARAKEYLAGREYRYISPVVLIRKSDDRAVELLGAALTNLPAIDGMTPVVNSALHAPASGEDGPDYREMYTRVMGMLGLGIDDGPEDASAVVAAMSRPEGYVPASDYDALEKKLRAHETESMIREALSDGRLTPPMAGWARGYAETDFDGFARFLGSACPVVPLARAANGIGSVTGAAQRAVNGLLGITDEQFTANVRTAD